VATSAGVRTAILPMRSTTSPSFSPAWSAAPWSVTRLTATPRPPGSPVARVAGSSWTSKSSTAACAVSRRRVQLDGCGGATLLIGAARSATSRSIFLPSRMMVILACAPGMLSCALIFRSSLVATTPPFHVNTTSPGSSPAASAGDPFSTLAISAPRPDASRSAASNAGSTGCASTPR